MSKSKTHIKGRIPDSVQYRNLKGMSYLPSVRDLNKQARKNAKKAIDERDFQ